MFRKLKFVFLISFFTVVFTVNVSGQFTKDNYNFREFQSKAYYFGLTFGFNNSNFQLFPSSRFIRNSSYSITEGLGGGGFNVSVVGNMKLGEYFDFRLLPGFSFVDRKIYYLSAQDEIEQIDNVESVLLQVPLQFRFKSDPFNDMRMFVLLGFKYTYDGASNARIANDRSPRIIKLSPHDYSVEAGAGVQLFFPYFIFSPEIKYSQGIGNILLYNRDLEKAAILEKILSRTFTVSLNFEG